MTDLEFLAAAAEAARRARASNGLDLEETQENAPDAGQPGVPDVRYEPNGSASTQSSLLDQPAADAADDDSPHQQTGEQPVDDDAEIARLAALPALQYERERDAAAKKLKCRVPILDKLVAAARGGNAGDTGGQGQALVLADIEPWPERVDGSQLLDDIVTEIRRYVVLGTPAAHGVALWAVTDHAFEQFFIFPRLFIKAPEKGCGKTTLLDVIGRLVSRPLVASNISAAALFRTIEAFNPTMLLDEADSFLRHNEDLRGVVDAGHQRQGAVIRTSGEDHEPRRFRVFAPIVMAGIGDLPGTIEDRSIKIQMRRRRPDERVASLRLDRATKFDELARRAARWAKDHAEELAAADPVMPASIYNRAADNWRPLLAMADLAGGDWPDRAREAAVELSVAGDDAESAKVLLLGDIRELFDKYPPQKVLFTREILTALHADETRPWSEWKNGKAMTHHQLAGQLKPFNIKPRTVRRGAENDKGYKLEWFDDAFARYLPPRSVTRSQLSDCADFEPLPSVTPAVTVTQVVTDDDAENTRVSAGCDGVTDREREALDEGEETVWTA